MRLFQRRVACCLGLQGLRLRARQATFREDLARLLIPLRLATAQRFLAATESRFRAAFDSLLARFWSALAGSFLAGDSARAWVAEATLALAASSRLCTTRVPTSYWSMTVPSNVSTRCSRFMAFFAFI